MKPTSIKVSISQDGLLPEQSIELGEIVMQGIPKKIMSALDFEKVDGDGKTTTFIGIMPVFVVIGEKTQQIEMELTVAHPELRDKVIEIFTTKPPATPAKAKTKPAPAKKSSASANKKKSAPSKTKAAKPAPRTKRKPKPATPAKKQSKGTKNK